jgi:hypothetical protein
MPVEMPVRDCVDQVSDRDFGDNEPLPPSTPPIRAWERSARLLGDSLIYDGLCRRKGGSRLKLARMQNAASKLRPLLEAMLTIFAQSEFFSF